MFPVSTPCKGKSKSQPFAHTFALTGRRRLYIDTQGVALGYELAALSGRSFSHFVRLSCAHASPLAIRLKTAQRFFWILNTLPERGSYSRIGACPYLMPQCSSILAAAPVRGAYRWRGLPCCKFRDMSPLQGRWRLFTNLDFYGILNTLPQATHNP